MSNSKAEREHCVCLIKSYVVVVCFPILSLTPPTIDFHQQGRNGEKQLLSFIQMFRHTRHLEGKKFNRRETTTNVTSNVSISRPTRRLINNFNCFLIHLRFSMFILSALYKNDKKAIFWSDVYSSTTLFIAYSSIMAQ